MDCDFYPKTNTRHNSGSNLKRPQLQVEQLDGCGLSSTGLNSPKKEWSIGSYGSSQAIPDGGILRVVIQNSKILKV